MEAAPDNETMHPKSGGIPERLRSAIRRWAGGNDTGVRAFSRALKELDVKGGSRTMLLRYLAGETDPTAAFIVDAAPVLGVRPEWLLTGRGPMVLGQVSPSLDLHDEADHGKEELWEKIDRLLDGLIQGWMYDRLRMYENHEYEEGSGFHALYRLCNLAYKYHLRIWARVGLDVPPVRWVVTEIVTHFRAPMYCASAAIVFAPLPGANFSLDRYMGGIASALLAMHDEMPHEHELYDDLQKNISEEALGLIIKDLHAQRAVLDEWQSFTDYRQIANRDDTLPPHLEIDSLMRKAESIARQHPTLMRVFATEARIFADEWAAEALSGPTAPRVTTVRRTYDDAWTCECVPYNAFGTCAHTQAADTLDAANPGLLGGSLELENRYFAPVDGN
jgi:transcriptional regulator with XRE-family HTH domain